MTRRLALGSFALVLACGDLSADTQGADGDGGTEPGCDDAVLLDRSDDPTARGPWPVGTKDVMLGDLRVAVWYPAELGSDEGTEPATYDIRDVLPPSQQELISDEDNPLQVCDCARDLPLDTTHGPYPFVVFVHGTAAWRSQSLTQMTHWASRGFVVIAADHPGLKLGDVLTIACPDDPSGERDLERDVDAMLAALASADAPLDFLAGHVDLERGAIAGHSAGGSAAAQLAGKPGIQVAIPMASGTEIPAGTGVQQSVFMGGLSDTVVDYSATAEAYQASPSPRALVGLANSGHLAFSDICEITNEAGTDLLTVAQEAGVCGTGFAGALFDCDPDFLEPAQANAIIDYASTSALESVLHCDASVASIADIEADHPGVAELEVD